MGMLTGWAVLFLVVLWTTGTKADYTIGVGIADCTGPPAEIVFMGYAKMTQKGNGLHLRQFSRAFIIEDKNHTIVFVSADVGMIGHGVKREVLEQLKTSFGNLYNDQNLVLSGTHTHGGPGGFLMNVLFDISIGGFCRETFNAMVAGIVQSIKRAHENKVIGKIYINSGDLTDANINRSPSAYLLNPKWERDQYSGDTDKEMIQLKFMESDSEKPLGVISWFPVHATSMNNTNRLVTSDNLGLASITFENEINSGILPGKGKFVAAFASSNLGDVSPNTKGARCINSGKPCETDSSTCDGEAKYCIASGPGTDMFESTYIIANKLKTKAVELFKKTGEEVTGPLRYIHQYVDMPSQEVDYDFMNGTVKKVHGCKPAMGYSFAAGTTDGPGEFDFKQGTNTTNEFWNLVRNFLAAPTKEDEACQAPKPILLATGRMKKPYPWQPDITSTQILMIGDVAIAAIPGEFTTMSGRRMKNAIREAVIENSGNENVKVIIAGLCNLYTDYITTPEEYQLQRYEAASTIYGPYTLPIYLNQYKKLVYALFDEDDIGPGPIPEDFSKSLISFIPPVIFDAPELFTSFGDCLQEPPINVKRGDIVQVKFVSGHPRNNIMQESSYLTVEIKDGDKWKVVATDASWETKFIWERTLLASSRVTIEWSVNNKVLPGTYRIRHFGYYKILFGGTKPYSGSTKTFQVL